MEKDVQAGSIQYSLTTIIQFARQEETNCIAKASWPLWRKCRSNICMVLGRVESSRSCVPNLRTVYIPTTVLYSLTIHVYRYYLIPNFAKENFKNKSASPLRVLIRGKNKVRSRNTNETHDNTSNKTKTLDLTVQFPPWIWRHGPMHENKPSTNEIKRRPIEAIASTARVPRTCACAFWKL
jgi:hypothetical protein